MVQLEKDIFVAAFGEFCATAMLLTLHCTGMDAIAATSGVFQWGFNYGIAVMIVIQIWEHISGAHVNPCITIAGIIVGKIRWDVAILYIMVQFLGAIFGFCVAFYLTTAHHSQPEYCITEPHITVKADQAFLLEFMMTSAWVLAQCAGWDKRAGGLQEAISLKLGLTVSSLAISGGYFTGASMNPARSLAPALLTGHYHSIWVYFTAPPLASVCMALMWKFLCSPASPSSE